MKFVFNTRSDNIVLPKNALLNKINQASETELKVLLYAAAVAAEKESFDEKDICALFNLDATEIMIALQFWRGAEILCVAGKDCPTPMKITEKKNPTLSKNDTPTYSGEEIAKLFEENTEIKLLIDQCQSIAGKVFNPHEINKLVSLYDYLGLSAEYIMLLYNYCKGKNKTTVHYVEKTAFNLYDEGVDTDEKLNEYIKYKEKFDSISGKIRRIFGTSDRAATKKEEQTIKRWTDEWGFDLDMIEYAYELTVNATNKASMPYANKILEKWHTRGITTVEGAKELDFEHKRSKQDENQNSSFDTDEFFEAALKKSYENLGKKPD